MRFGSPHLHLRSTGSTNGVAKELAGAGAPGGTVVTAAEQTEGRGRQGRSWFAAPGAALLYTAVLRPLGDRPLLPLAVPLAVCEAAESLAPVRCGVKWPNDVRIGERKLAGVLIEGRPDAPDGGWAVIGVGLNLTAGEDDLPPEVRGIATSLSRESGTAPRAADARPVLDAALARWCEAGDSEVLAAYRDRDVLAGRSISWDGGSGTAAGVDDRGHLLVEIGDGKTLALGAGEVHLTVGG